MTSTTTPASGIVTDHSRAIPDGAHSHGNVPRSKPQGSRAERLTSFDLADIPVPSGREEEWRFSPISRLAPLFDENISGTGVRTTVTGPGIVADDATTGLAGRPGDRTAAVAWHAAVCPQQIIVRGQHADQLTTVRVTGTDLEPAATHLVVQAEPHAEGVVVIDHVGTAVLTETIEIDVADGAHLTVVSIQDWAPGSVHASAQRARIGRDATLRHIVVTLGGDVVRITPDAEFAGEGGEVQMNGLYFTDAGQHQEHRLFVDHNVPRCTSRVAYKGALQGDGAHAVWVGDVLIRAEAEGTDTYELNRNLVLTEGARADSVPNLEIKTGRIEGAGHASATGRFDDEQLFYLMARGIREAEARRLVVRGFFAELIAGIGVPEVEERLVSAIERELARSADVIEGTAGARSREADR